MKDSRSAVILLICAVAAVIQFYLSTFCFNDSRMQYELYTGLFCGCFCFVPWLFYHFRIMKLPIWMVVFINMAIFFHGYGVLVMNYDTLVFYDTVTHTFSSYVISLCTLLTLFSLQRYNHKIRFTVGVMAIFVVFLMVSFGVLWEVFECAVDVFTGTEMQYCPWDTLRDMICNSVGSIIASIFISIVMRKTSIESLIDSIEIHPRLKKFLSSSDS